MLPCAHAIMQACGARRRAPTACALIVATAACAVYAPQVADVLSFLGGFFDSFLNFIFPVLIARNVLSPGQWYIAMVLVMPLSIFLILYSLLAVPG